MSEFERNYTLAEQHMHGSIGALVSLARCLRVWGEAQNKEAEGTHTREAREERCGARFAVFWKAHSMGNYLLLNAIDRVSVCLFPHNFNKSRQCSSSTLF